MTVSADREVHLPDDRPPAFANALMRWALTTPVLERWVGNDVALITFVGRKTGTVYTVPVSYDRHDDTVTIVTKRVRKWWRNFETPHEVALRLAGQDYVGKAQIVTDPTTALEFMVGYLKNRPIDAKAYGLARDVTREKIAKIVPDIVVIRVQVSPGD